MSVRVDTHPSRGRVLTATRAFSAGQVLFEDDALVAASWDADVCLECAVDPTASDSMQGTHPSVECDDLERHGYPEQLRLAIDEVEEAVCEAICPGEAEDPEDSLDRARCLIRCLVMHGRGDGALLAPLADLTVANAERDTRMAAAVRSADAVRACGLLPDALSDADVGQMLGALNTNSHTLDLGGSALFPLGAMMHSDCAPNCAYYTAVRGSRLTVVATRAIAAGEAVCIDYGNNFYRPTAERQEGLLATYGFHCDCASCNELPDRCRAFWCPRCSEGILAPRGAGVDAGDWRCVSCDSVLSDSEREKFLAAEAELEETLDSEEAIEAALRKECVLHPSHHAFFWCYKALFDAMLEAQSPPQETERVWRIAIELAESVLTPNHPELFVMYDQLAQLRVPRDMPGAIAAWSQALELALLSADPLTQTQTQSLLGRPPTSTHELQARYAKQAKDR